MYEYLKKFNTVLCFGFVFMAVIIIVQCLADQYFYFPELTQAQALKQYGNEYMSACLLFFFGFMGLNR